MAKIISFFNHKGGVSKTTTTFNIGWLLASRGKKVLLVDADPQCNLTGMIFGYRQGLELEEFYREFPHRNIRDALSPAFESRPKMIDAPDPVEVVGRKGLGLLPGHITFAEYEVTLGIAQELSGSIQTLQNLPGSTYFLLNKAAEKFSADYILIDMSPSLNSINQNLLMISDFFIVPCSPDLFSVMAIASLANVLPKWRDWAERAATMPVLRDASYPFPKPRLKFLGTIAQKFRLRSGSPTGGFQGWIDRIDSTVKETLAPALSKAGLLLPPRIYSPLGGSYNLASIPDFNTLIAKSQEHQTPVFDLSSDQLDQVGMVLKTTLTTQTELKRIFNDLVDKFISMTDADQSA